MATAFAITQSSDWQANFQLTVYQQGWRLGGKGASSRNPGARWRNQEHGLHILGGFYHNAFALLRNCYTAWNLPSPGGPGQDFAQVFVPQSYCTVWEANGAGGWRAVDLNLPTNGNAPGEDPIELSISAAVTKIFEVIRDQAATIAAALAAGLPTGAPTTVDHTLISSLADQVVNLATSAVATAGATIDSAAAPLASGLPDLALGALAAAIQAVLGQLLNAAAGWTPTGREPNQAMMGAVAAICALGIVQDRLFDAGFDSINDQELTAWLTKHGATPAVLASPYVRAGFDYAFAYAGGVTNPAQPSIAAGVALRAFLRLLLTYNGALFFHMQGGMGEAVFTPLYEVLSARGVEFRFFHRVSAIRTGPGGDQIQAIDLQVQAVPINGPDKYQPLVTDPQGHRVWPPCPLYDQLENGAQLAAQADDFESAWAPDRGQPTTTLTRGADFTDVVLAISVGALAELTQDLAKGSGAWSAMLQSAQTIPVAGVQIWSCNSAAAMGGAPRPALDTAYAEPFATWADMSFLLARETPADPPLQYLAYLCAPLPPQVPAAGQNFPLAQQQRVETICNTWLQDHLGLLLPGAVDPTGAVRPNFVADHFVRANESPSDHYVLSPPGSISRRLTPAGSGFTNLFLAGDWTRNGLDAGAFEAAVMSGLECARAITGDPIVVYGETDKS
jgi:uncharacterized protein with NAD-binding domain and iron-sulfur cluster